MKTLNFLFVLAICFMAISHVSANYYIIKTFENYKSGGANEGHLTPEGEKRVDCFVSLVGSKINQPNGIFYKKDGTDKNGATKINSRKFTAEAIAEKLNVPANEIDGGSAQLATIKETLLDANGITDAVFVWSDKEKATELAKALGATNAPKSFKKSNYGYIWAISGDQLEEIKMGCDGVPDVINGSSSVRVAVMSIVVSIMASLYFLF